MSWREMRNFSEMMRALGYPRIISIENFRTPNFPLLSEILKWLAMRFDPNVDVPKCLDTEQDRVIFIKLIVQFMATKAFIKLNAKRLYKADGYAVKEILKIVNLLYAALNIEAKPDDEESVEFNLAEIVNVERLKQLQQTRALASQLITAGAALHSFMSREVDLRQTRNDAICRQLDIEWVEKCIASARDSIQEEIARTESALINITADEGTLDGKIEKRRNELERNQKRLSTLQSVRPAYMEEYEQLEEELNIYYETYLTLFRNLSYLENLKEEIMQSDDTPFQENDAPIKFSLDEIQKTKSNGEVGDFRTENVDRELSETTGKANGNVGGFGGVFRGTISSTRVPEIPEEDEDDADDF
uniref:Clusterin-associated protein 1 n=1 Tax=Mesocestoides corti TaxID=53468 RepID=A0A5K3EIM4_MESCO